MNVCFFPRLKVGYRRAATSDLPEEELVGRGMYRWDGDANQDANRFLLERLRMVQLHRCWTVDPQRGPRSRLGGAQCPRVAETERLLLLPIWVEMKKKLTEERRRLLS